MYLISDYQLSFSINKIAFTYRHIVYDVKIETGLSGGLAYTNNLLPAAPVGLLGLLLLFQVNHSTRNGRV